MREQTVTLMISLRAAREWVEAGSRETIAKPLTTSGKEGSRAWTGWEHHSEKRDSFKTGGGKKSPGNYVNGAFNGVCDGGVWLL